VAPSASVVTSVRSNLGGSSPELGSQATVGKRVTVRCFLAERFMRAYMKRYRRRRILRHTPPSARYLEGLGISSCNLRRIQAGSSLCHPGMRLRLGLVEGLCPTLGTSSFCSSRCRLDPWTSLGSHASTQLLTSLTIAKTSSLHIWRSCFSRIFLSLASECAFSIAACATAACVFLSRSTFRASHACSAYVCKRTTTSCDFSSAGATCVTICSIISHKTPYTWHSIRSSSAMRVISIFVARSCPILILSHSRIRSSSICEAFSC
jgi:hypothetical protein